MKTSLKLLALIIAAGYPLVAFAEFAGAPMPASLNAENALALFSVVIAALLMIGDYSRRRLTFIGAPSRRPKSAAQRKRESHRLAA